MQATVRVTPATNDNVGSIEVVDQQWQKVGLPVPTPEEVAAFKARQEQGWAAEAPAPPASVDAALAAFRAQQAIPGAAPTVPAVLSHDPGSVSRETSDIEAELARRHAASKPLAEMSEAELMAELDRRRGAQTAPALPGDIRMGDNAPALPRFTADPIAEAMRISQIAGGRLVEPIQGAANLNPEGNLIAPKRTSRDPRTWANGEQRTGNPFAPPIGEPEAEDGYVEAQVTLKDGSKATVKIPLSQVRAAVEEVPAPDSEVGANFRCLQDGTPGRGGYVRSGCPDFHAERVPGVYIRCPRCHSKTVQEIA